MDLRFTWDAGKARANVRKHGVTFAEAATLLGDALSLTIADPVHSVGEERWVDVGMSGRRTQGGSLWLCISNANPRFGSSVRGSLTETSGMTMKKAKQDDGSTVDENDD